MPKQTTEQAAEALRRLAGWSSQAPPPSEFEAGVRWAHDRVVEEPWVKTKVGEGERVLDVGGATSRYLRELPASCKVYALDIRPSAPQRGLAIIQANLMHAPFRLATFDTVTCISTIEHIGCWVYGQTVDEFGDLVAMRHMRRLLRPGGRLLLTCPFGRGGVYSWLRIYNPPTFARLTAGFRVQSVQYFRREGERYLPCQAEDLAAAGFDFEKIRADGVVLAELVPTDGPAFQLARLSLRLQRLLRRLTGADRRPFWSEP